MRQSLLLGARCAQRARLKSRCASLTSGTQCENENRRNEVSSATRVVSSLREAAKAPETVTTLDLSTSEAFICKNLMCEKVGELCVCRLSLFFYEHGMQRSFKNLTSLMLRRNNLRAIPEAIQYLTSSKLELVDLAQNQIQHVDDATLSLLNQHTNLKVLDLRENPIEDKQELQLRSQKLLKTSCEVLL